MLLQYLPSSAAHDQSWALSEGWMDLGTIRWPAHGWGLARPLLNHLPAAALPVGCLHRLDALQSNKEKACWQALQVPVLRHACSNRQQKGISQMSAGAHMSNVFTMLNSRLT